MSDKEFTNKIAESISNIFKKQKLKTLNDKIDRLEKILEKK